MLYYLSIFLKDNFHFFNFMHYVSIRAMAALVTALLGSILGGEWCIVLARRLFRVKSREYTPEGHRAKDGMPTMGGIFVVGLVLMTALLWCDLSEPHVWIMLLCLLLFAVIGWWDDWSKIKYRKGISEKYKFAAQVGAAALVVGLWMGVCSPDSTVILPVFKNVSLSLPPVVAWLWWIFVIVGASNAVNLTDGLDGLAIGSLIPNFATYASIAYLAGHAVFAAYLHIPYAATAELAIVGSILVGASLGFLWFNAYPAQIFMGDVGSLSLGAALGLMAIMTRQELLLVISGMLFVVEAVSVMLQVFSFRLWKKRLFRMAPIHHHFELLGWPEAKITTRFGIVTCIACLIALMLLKVR